MAWRLLQKCCLLELRFSPQQEFLFRESLRSQKAWFGVILLILLSLLLLGRLVAFSYADARSNPQQVAFTVVAVGALLAVLLAQFRPCRPRTFELLTVGLLVLAQLALLGSAQLLTPGDNVSAEADIPLGVASVLTAGIGCLVLPVRCCASYVLCVCAASDSGALAILEISRRRAQVSTMVTWILLAMLSALIHQGAVWKELAKRAAFARLKMKEAQDLEGFLPVSPNPAAAPMSKTLGPRPGKASSHASPGNTLTMGPFSTDNLPGVVSQGCGGSSLPSPERPHMRGTMRGNTEGSRQMRKAVPEGVSLRLQGHGGATYGSENVQPSGVRSGAGPPQGSDGGGCSARVSSRSILSAPPGSSAWIGSTRYLKRSQSAPVLAPVPVGRSKARARSRSLGALPLVHQQSSGNIFASEASLPLKDGPVAQEANATPNTSRHSTPKGLREWPSIIAEGSEGSGSISIPGPAEVVEPSSVDSLQDCESSHRALSLSAPVADSSPGLLMQLRQSPSVLHPREDSPPSDQVADGVDRLLRRPMDPSPRVYSSNSMDSQVSFELSDSSLGQSSGRCNLASEMEELRECPIQVSLKEQREGEEPQPLLYTDATTQVEVGDRRLAMHDAEVETSLVWKKEGFHCKNCAKPPLPPGVKSTTPSPRELDGGHRRGASRERSRSRSRDLSQGQGDGGDFHFDGLWILIHPAQDQVGAWSHWMRSE